MKCVKIRPIILPVPIPLTRLGRVLQDDTYLSQRCEACGRKIAGHLNTPMKAPLFAVIGGARKRAEQVPIMRCTTPHVSVAAFLHPKKAMTGSALDMIGSARLLCPESFYGDLIFRPKHLCLGHIPSLKITKMNLWHCSKRIPCSSTDMSLGSM